MKIVVVGSGLGGLGTALRLQGAGHEVVVLEQMATPGGRASQIKDCGFTWDTGPSLLTMPWVLEETFAAGGLDFAREVELVQLEPYYRIHWADEPRHLDFVSDRDEMRAGLAQFSERDAAAFNGFLAALKPIYEEGILAAGRRPFNSPTELAAFLPTLIRLGAAQPLYRFISKHFENDRVREAMSFHSLFIGGNPYRVPAIYGALVYLQFLDGVWYSKGGVYAIVEAMARALDVRTETQVAEIEHRGGRATGVVTNDGVRIAADAVVWNGDATKLDALLGVRPQLLRTRRTTMSALLLYLGTDRPFPQLLHHTLTVGDGYRTFIRDVTGRRKLPSTYSTYIHAPARTEAAMAPEGGDSLAILMPVPNLRSGDRWTSGETDALAGAVVEDLEANFGLAGLESATVVEHRMTPVDFEQRYGAADGNAFAIEPSLHQSAAFRVPNRHPRVRGVYAVGGGSHPGAGVPGVLFGAEVTAGLVEADHPRAARIAVPGSPGVRGGTASEPSTTSTVATGSAA